MARDEWTVAPAGPSWWGRVGQLVSPGSSKPATVPLLAMFLAAIAYAGSLGLDWISASGALHPRSTGQPMPVDGGAFVTDTSSLTDVTDASNVTTLDVMGLVYGLGALALLGLGFAVLSRPEQALRWRMAAAGLSVGLLGVVVAAVLRLPKLLLGNAAVFADASLSDLSRSYEPGIFCAVAAAVLPALAVWIRSAPAARAAVTMAALSTQPAMPDVPAPGTPAYDASVWDRLYSDPGRWRRGGLPPALDLTVTPDD